MTETVTKKPRAKREPFSVKAAVLSQIVKEQRASAKLRVKVEASDKKIADLNAVVAKLGSI